MPGPASPGAAHMPWPLHIVPAEHSMKGSVPAGTGLHMPSLPGRLHCWHVPVHAFSQHTPSTQCPPEPHSGSVVHEPPTGVAAMQCICGPQRSPVGQLVAVHGGSHDTPSDAHVCESQIITVGDMHVPAAVQVPPSYTRPIVQRAAPQDVPTVTADQSLMSRDESHTWQGYTGWRMPSVTHSPPMMQPLVTEWPQLRALSLHVSVVQV